MKALLPARSARTPRRLRSSGLALASSLALLTAALLLLLACSSGGSGESASTTAASAPNSGGMNPATTAAPGSFVGSPGPGGVGTVVAAADGAGTYIDVTPDELAAMLESKDFLLINTHTPYEGEIEQTDLFLPYDKAAQQLGQLPQDKDAKIVVYCRSDRMSRISVEEWVRAGYTNLYNLDGGFVAWEDAGYELLHK